jgi:hypothetical protein
MPRHKNSGSFEKGIIPWNKGHKKQFCPQGHDTFICGRDNGGKGACKECRKIRRKKHHDENLEAVREYHRNYYHKNQEHLEELRKKRIAKDPEKFEAWKREYRKKNEKRIKRQIRAHHLKTTFNITIEEYEEIFKHQKGKCAGCLRPQENFKINFAVDHDHKTNTIRGLLCNDCNTTLGKLLEDPKIFRRLAAYLEKHKKKLNKTNKNKSRRT